MLLRRRPLPKHIEPRPSMSLIVLVKTAIGASHFDIRLSMYEETLSMIVNENPLIRGIRSDVTQCKRFECEHEAMRSKAQAQSDTLSWIPYANLPTTPMTVAFKATGCQQFFEVETALSPPVCDAKSQSQPSYV